MQSFQKFLQSRIPVHIHGHIIRNRPVHFPGQVNRGHRALQPVQGLTEYERFVFIASASTKGFYSQPANEYALINSDLLLFYFDWCASIFQNF